MKIIINDIEYKLIKDYRDCFDYDEVKEKMTDLDYFDGFDFVFGDFSYDKLRLKGFCKKGNQSFNSTNDYDKLQDYIDNYCSFGCRYFILEKISDKSK